MVKKKYDILVDVISTDKNQIKTTIQETINTQTRMDSNLEFFQGIFIGKENDIINMLLLFKRRTE